METRFPGKIRENLHTIFNKGAKPSILTFSIVFDLIPSPQHFFFSLSIFLDFYPKTFANKVNKKMIVYIIKLCNSVIVSVYMLVLKLSNTIGIEYSWKKL